MVISTLVDVMLEKEHSECNLSRCGLLVRRVCHIPRPEQSSNTAKQASLV